MEKGLGQLCLWGGGSSAGSLSLTHEVALASTLPPYLQPLCGLGRAGLPGPWWWWG